MNHARATQAEGRADEKAAKAKAAQHEADKHRQREAATLRVSQADPDLILIADQANQVLEHVKKLG